MFPFPEQIEIPGTPGKREVYWIDKKNVEPTPFDSEYLERLKARDPRTQEHFAGHFNRLVVIKLRSHGIYGTQLDDLRQETLIRALKSIYKGKIDSPESLPAFVFGVCNNVIKEFIRGEITSRVRDTNDFPDLADSRYSADDSVRYQEVRKSVTHVLRSLPEKDRAILSAVFLAEDDKDAICQRHGITRDYLRVLLHRSLINARKILDRRPDA
jgi:RNA polymerase sigma factor (sigma-70 family)